MKRLLAAAVGMGILMSAGLASDVSAHGVFFAKRADQVALVLGEGPGDNVYDRSCVTSIQGYDTSFRAIPVETGRYADYVTVAPQDNLGVTTTFFDYGFFTKDTNGKTHNAPFDQVANAVKTTHAVKYNVHYWSPEVKPGHIYNVPIQIVPEVNPLTLRKGDRLNIRVYKDGKPYANAPLIADVINDLTNESEADAQGRASLEVTANGLNVIGVEVGFPTDDPNTQVKYFSSLSFIIEPE